MVLTWIPLFKSSLLEADIGDDFSAPLSSKASFFQEYFGSAKEGASTQPMLSPLMRTLHLAGCTVFRTESDFCRIVSLVDSLFCFLPHSTTIIHPLKMPLAGLLGRKHTFWLKRSFFAQVSVSWTTLFLLIFISGELAIQEASIKDQ